MATEIIGMYAVISGGEESALANIDIPMDGVITAVDWDMCGNLDADGEEIRAELSFIATHQLTSNDVRGRISSVCAQISLTTSGAPVVGVNKFVGPMELPVAGGERLYLHASTTAGVTGDVRCNIHLDVATRSRRRTARR